jgi:trk system potassium uptake protein
VRWTADRMLRRLLPVGAAPLFRDPSGKVVLAEVPVHRGWIGRQVDDVAKAAGGIRVAYLSRFGDGIVPTSSTVFQDGDLLHVVAEEADLPRIEGLLDTPPPKD